LNTLLAESVSEVVIQPVSAAAKTGEGASIVVVMPCYNEWESMGLLLKALETALSATACHCDVLLVDDCSSVPRPLDLVCGTFEMLNRIDVLRLRRNIGHQRAICVGLSHIYEHWKADAVVIMDADGEDRPDDIPRLLAAFEQHGRTAIVFAERTRRSEGLLFRLGYAAYRALHLMLTGIRVKVGNFSIVPWEHLGALVVTSETWNHYAASVFRSKVGHIAIPTTRGTRLAGKSKLNFVGLVVHGMSAIAVFLDVVAVRLSLLACAGAGLLLLLCVAVLVVRYGTSLAIPGWATMTMGLLLVILTQMFVFILGLAGLVLFYRDNLSFIPIRDYKYFVGECCEIYRAHESLQLRR
jgi:polyisoprenyl-phosphate glycosyltransferase